MLRIDPVADIGQLGEGLPAVSAAPRDEQAHVVSRHRARRTATPGTLASRGRRSTTTSKICPRAHRTSFASPAPPPHVQCPDHTLVASRLAVLDEIGKTRLPGDLRVPRPGEEPPCVRVYGWVEREHPCQFRALEPALPSSLLDDRNDRDSTGPHLPFLSLQLNGHDCRPRAPARGGPLPTSERSWSGCRRGRWSW